MISIRRPEDTYPPQQAMPPQGAEQAPMQEPVQEPAPEAAVEPAQQEKQPMTKRQAIIAAAMKADSMFGENDDDSWENAFRKFMQANFLEVPGKQSLSVRG